MKILLEKIKNDVDITMSLNKGYSRKNGNPENWVREPMDHTGFLHTHVNGTLTIELRQSISERINIRRVIPYREPG